MLFLQLNQVGQGGQNGTLLKPVLDGLFLEKGVPACMGAEFSRVNPGKKCPNIVFCFKVLLQKLRAL